MRVVAAGVHHAGVLAGEAEPGLLLHGQGVYIRAYGHAFAGLRALYERDRAGGQGALDAVHAEALEEGGYLFRRAELRVAQLRMAVEVAPPADHFVVNAVYTAPDIHYVYPFWLT